LAVFYLAVLAPVMTAARHAAVGENDTKASVLIDTFLKGHYLDNFDYDDATDQFLERSFDPVAVGFLIGETRHFGYRLGQTMDYLLYAAVPRALWPEKPTVTRGAWFDAYIGQAGTEEGATTSLGQTAIGELYWNFGLIGVVIGMVGLGTFFGYLWRIAGPDPRHEPIRMVLYVSLMLGMPDMSEAGTVFIHLLHKLLVFGAIFLVLERRGHLKKVAAQ
jgi:hypothetical protein